MSSNPIHTRRSIRKYKNLPVTKEQIEEVILAGRAAPSAKNRQPWNCIVLEEQTKADFIECMETGILREEHVNAMLPLSQSGISDAKHTVQIMKQAPVLIVVINTEGKSPFEPLNPDERFTEICNNLSIGAFIQNMLLQAEQMGLGTLWIANTCFAYKELMTYLNVTGQLIGAVALGHADEQPMERPRKELSSIMESE